MTELRQRMLEELQRRNFASSTIRYYIRTVRDFAAYFHKPPDQLGAEELRQFQLYMLRDRKLATGTVENRMTALHFFFKKVLQRYDPELFDMQLTRVPKKLPVVLSPEEVEKLIAAAPNIRYRTMLLLLYATGLRRAETSQLKIADIDSQRMVIHVHEGKNSRDRELPLTPKLLEALRAYWRACKDKPRVYLFPTRFKKTDEERPVTDKAVWHACRESARQGRTVEASRAAYATTYFRDPPHRKWNRSTHASALDGSPKAARHDLIRAPLPATLARRRQSSRTHQHPRFAAKTAGAAGARQRWSSRGLRLPISSAQHLHRLPVSMIPILLNLHADASRPIKLRSRSDYGALVAIQNP